MNDDVYKETNGSYHREFQASQAAKFSALEGVINKGFNESHRVMRDGFQLIASELRVTRDAGVVPVPLLEKLLTANNEAYKEMFKANNDNTSKIFSRLCWLIGALVIWATGMMWAPNKTDKVTFQTTEAVKP